MKAAIIEEYGTAEQVRIKENIKRPTPGDDEVLVKTRAASMSPGDIEIRRGDYKLFTSKKSMGQKTLMGLEFSGEVVARGKNVKKFRAGDEVYGYTHLLKGDKTHAEYLTIRAALIAHKPANITHEEAAALPVGMLTSIRALRDVGKLQSGQSLLLNGASGGVGVYATQLGKVMGARVTSVSGAASFDILEELGADKRLDYKKDDPANLDEKFDLVFDIANKSTFASSKKFMSEKGTYITSNPLKDLTGYLRAAFTSQSSGYLMVMEGDTADLEYTNELIEAGKIKPLVEKVFNFEDIVEAHKYFETNRRRGKVILKMGD